MRDEKLLLESSSTLYVIVVCVCVCIYSISNTERERKRERCSTRACVYSADALLFYPKEQKEQKEQKSKKKSKKADRNFLLKKKVDAS